jgi:alkaline phosphatase D
LAHPENAHSVHVDLVGLEAGREYWYRFKAGDEISPVGRAITTPAVNANVDKMRFAFASCQQYEMGYFNAYRDMVKQDPELIIHLGDYIYESTWDHSLVRHMPVNDANDLDEYRAIHAAYKLDADLQAAHRHTSWLFTWDDHEVDNDYAADQEEHFADPRDFIKRRAAAYKAYYEHLPLRRVARPVGADMKLYHRVWFGDLVEFNMIDNRQYRDDHACQTPQDGGWRLIGEACKELFDPSRTILGYNQERWLNYGFARRKAVWNVLAQQTIFSDHDRVAGPEWGVGSDDWNGYPAARQRIIEMIMKRKASNPVIIGGDVHAYYTSDVKTDFRDPNSATIASELICTSITSPNDYHESSVATLPDNPHIKFFDGRYRGYSLVNLNKKEWRTDLRTVANVLDPKSTSSTLKSFVIEAGKAGAIEA